MEAKVKQVYEIVNPSDAVTIEAGDPLLASVAILCLADGQYTIKDKNGESIMPLFLFGGAIEWLKEQGITDLKEYIETHRVKLAEALESFVYGDFSDRELYQDAIAKMPNPQDRQEFKAKWDDEKRSSLTDIGGIKVPKRIICYQYVIRDNQQTCYPHYKLTPKYYSSRRACEKDWGAKNTEYCFSVIKPLRISRQGGRLAELLTEHERAR